MRYKEINSILFIYQFFETFLTSLSLISRGMIINLIPYILATLSLKYKNLKNFFFNKILLFFSLGIILFIITILFANTYRIVKSTADIENKFDYKYLVKTAIYKTDQKGFINISSSEINIKKFSESLVNPLKHIKYLIFYRWVGIDAVMAVEATENKNFNFYKSSWMETYEENKLSFYDTRVLNNLDYNLSISNNPKLHVVTLPGFIAHSYYTGSLIFVVLSCFFASILCHLIILCYNYFTNNVFLTAILSNILAYRLVHWGFAPLNTYNLLIGIFGTLLLIVLSNHVAKKFFTRNNYYKYTLFLLIFSHLYLWDMSNILAQVNFPFQIFRYSILFILIINFFNLHKYIDKHLYIFIFIFFISICSKLFFF